MSSRLRYAAPWLKTVMLRCAWAAIPVTAITIYTASSSASTRGAATKAIIAVAALDPFHRLLCAGQPSALSRSRIALFHPAHLSSDDLTEDRLDRRKLEDDECFVS